jgi:hypothetical protein
MDEYSATTSGGKHGSSHRIGIHAATMREDAAAVSLLPLGRGNTGSCRRIVQSESNKSVIQRFKQDREVKKKHHAKTP